jgi:hypothetical protein
MDVNERFTLMLGSSHFFSKTIDFNSLCLYVKIEFILDFFFKLMLERIDPIFNIFKYIIISYQGTRFSFI